MHSCIYLCFSIFLSELGTDLLKSTTAFVMRNVPSVEHFRSSQCLWLDWMCQVGELTPNCGGIKDSPTHHWQLLSAQIPSTLACSCAIANHPSFVTSPRAVLELCANWSSARDDGLFIFTSRGKFLMSAVVQIRIWTISCAPPLYYYLQFPRMSEFLLKIFSGKEEKLWFWTNFWWWCAMGSSINVNVILEACNMNWTEVDTDKMDESHDLFESILFRVCKFYSPGSD